MTPEEFTQMTRETFGSTAGSEGGCLKFALVFCGVFPESIIFYNGDHVRIWYRGRFYDNFGVYGAIGGLGYLSLTNDYTCDQIAQSFHLKGMMLEALKRYYRSGVI